MAYAVSDVALDTGPQGPSPLTPSDGPPNGDEVARPYLNPGEARLNALRPRLDPTRLEVAQPAPAPAPPDLPLPARVAARLFVVERVDRRGRVRLEDAVGVLGWSAGDRLAWAAAGREAVLRRGDGGPVVLGSDGRVTLPRAAWYAIGVGQGERAAVETDQERGEVYIFSCTRLVRL